jgi:hypothetical protein
MVDDVTSARCGLCARGLIKICVVVLAITGQAVWVGVQVSAIRATLDTDVYRQPGGRGNTDVADARAAIRGAATG